MILSSGYATRYSAGEVRLVATWAAGAQAGFPAIPTVWGLDLASASLVIIDVASVASLAVSRRDPLRSIRAG